MIQDELTNSFDNEQLRELLKRDPFFGIELFKRIDDEPKHMIDSGILGSMGWQRIEYYPRTADIRILKAEPAWNGEVAINVYYWNLRKNKGSYPYRPIDQFDPVIRNAISALRLAKIDTFCPNGYPEIVQAMSRITRGPKLSPDKFIAGKYYLIVGGLNDGSIFCFSKVEVRNNSQYWSEHHFHCSRKNLLGKEGSLHIGRDMNPYINFTSGIFGSYYESKLTGEHQFNGDEWFGYELSDVDIAVFSHFAPITYDNYAGRGVSRDLLCIWVTLQGLQYARWGKDEITETNPHYKHEYTSVNVTNYHKALELIINRFGEEMFALQVESIFL